jgi:hypothetical protein
MKRLAHHTASLVTTAWVGGLWAIGYLAVPVLFHAQPDRQLAGMLAGHMFETLGYVGMVCGTYLLAHRLLVSRTWREPQFLLIAAMLAFSLLIQFGIQPMMAELKAQALPLEVMQSAYADRFKTWHGVSSILYLVESLLGAALVTQNFRAPAK